ncbi:hypothetical protein AFK24_06115 [Pseudomonas syringae]|uniref:Uncharacterized protein n=1 Tax=Pseudomonas syringae TaxID=317 RepID=A0A1C7Z845_PSESX|nr:hypothetical protein [Pseudomonas syringae]OCR26111.1 hypothetical protein AFK24_06115 [Pseudomonas syringae]
MTIKWKKIATVSSIFAAWFGLLLGGWSAYLGQQDTKFNHATKVKEQKTASYLSAIEILKLQKKPKELDTLRNDYLNDEAAWRAEDDISVIIQPMLDNKLNDIPPADMERIKRLLNRQVNNDQFHPSAILLGGAYFAINENVKAKEYLEYAKRTGYDPPANAFLSVVYARLVDTSVDSAYASGEPTFLTPTPKAMVSTSILI